MTEIRIEHVELLRFITAALMRSGISAGDAAVIAEALAWANLRGQDGHGVARLPLYLKWIEAGDLDPHATLEVRWTRPGSFIVEARRTAGPLAMRSAVNAGVQAVGTEGIVAGAIRGCSHTGALGQYVQAIARQGHIGIIIAAGPPLMAYHNAAVPSLSTSPIAIGVPRTSGEPIVLDMATSAVAYGHLLEARNRGAPIPQHWALTERGEPTTDPRLAHTLLPLGGPKGSGLALMFELLSGVLCANPILLPALLNPLANRPGSASGQQNSLVLMLNIGAFRDSQDYRDDVDALANAILSLPTQPGTQPLYLPGGRGEQCERERRTAGIPLPPGLKQQLDELGRQLGIEPLEGRAPSRTQS